MRKKVIFFMLITFLFLILLPAFAERDKDSNFLESYPGGDYGLNIGRGYEMMPDGEFLPPGGFRDPIKDTKYGPMTPKEFLVFPTYKPKSSDRPPGQKEAFKAYIFHEATTSAEGTTTTGGSKLWGVSSP